MPGISRIPEAFKTEFAETALSAAGGTRMTCPITIWLWGIIGILLIIVLALLTKIHLLRKAAREIQEAFAERLDTDTNTLIDISSGDRHMRSLAVSLNKELARLRDQRRRFQQGDSELKNAVTNVSHDLRTPLTAICGYLALLEQEEKSEDAARYVAILHNRARMLNTLTEELFCYSVIAAEGEALRKEDILINEALEESIAAYYTALKEHGIVPQIRMSPKRIIRSLDRSALSRILSNLLSNAVKYSGGDLDILLCDSGEITFSNTAPGLGKVQVEKLFDRFYTVDSGRKSTGLGLAIARTLAERMGGAIWAEYGDSVLRIHLAFPTSPPGV